jgi:hypothetical protein
MERILDGRFDERWVQKQVEQTIGVWRTCAGDLPRGLPQFATGEQRKREKAYDDGLRAVQREARKAPRNAAERLETRQRIVAVFPRFAAIALGLEGEAIQLLTDGFLPAGTQLAQWARNYDPTLSHEDIIQACRNAWTACGLQALLGEPLGITPSILGYSLLYPYSDNFLDREAVSNAEKLRFSARFRERLRGHGPATNSAREAAVWAMVQLVEQQYPRARFPQVFDCLLAIHHAQEESIAQLKSGGLCDDEEVLRISCAKGGTSVLADACLVRGSLDDAESLFSFEWGALLQLGDDLQDVREDWRNGSSTLFTRAIAEGKPLDTLAIQLLNLSQHVAAGMDRLPGGDSTLRELLRMSWRSLIVMAVANVPEHFTPQFLDTLERCSPFRFAFLRKRNKRFIGQEGLYTVLFDAFVETCNDPVSLSPLPHAISYKWDDPEVDAAQAVSAALCA